MCVFVSAQDFFKGMAEVRICDSVSASAFLGLLNSLPQTPTRGLALALPAEWTFPGMAPEYDPPQASVTTSSQDLDMLGLLFTAVKLAFVNGLLLID